HQRAREHARENADHETAAQGSGCEARDRADQHHPFDAEVEDAGFLGDELAERGENQRRACGDRGGEDEDEIVHYAAALAAIVAATTGRTSLIRQLINTSEPSRKKSSMPWNNPVIAD